MKRSDVAKLVIEIPSDKRRMGRMEVTDRNDELTILPFYMGSNGGLVLEALMGLIVTQIEADYGSYEG